MDKEKLMDYMLLKIITMLYITIEELFENEQEFAFFIHFKLICINAHLIICLQFYIFAPFPVKSIKDTQI